MTEEIVDKQQEQPLKKDYGFIYVLTNLSMPGLVKIGQTEQHPYARAEEISAHTGVPTPFVVACYFSVVDRLGAERAAHSALASYRLSDGREFFRLNPDEAEVILERALDKIILKPPGGRRVLVPLESRGKCPQCSGSLVKNVIGTWQYLKCIECGQVFRELSTE